MAQLFNAQHYAAFDPPKPFEDDPQVRQERVRVREQFLWLDQSLAPFIESHGWNLHRHHQKQHYTSSTHFIWINEFGEVSDTEGATGRWQPIVKEIGWLWLHYGKSKDQLKLYKNLMGVYQYNRRDDENYHNAFYCHTRIQLYISNSYYGVWLLYTDKDRYDKSNFLKELRKSPVFKKEFWNRLQPAMDNGFCYVVGDEELPLTKDLSP